MRGPCRTGPCIDYQMLQISLLLLLFLFVKEGVETNDAKVPEEVAVKVAREL